MKKAEKDILKKTHSAATIFNIVNSAKLNDKPVMGWRLVCGQKITVNLFIRVVRKSRDEIVVRAFNEEGKKTLGNLLSSSQTLNFFLSEDLALFQTEVKSFEANGDVVARMPKMMAQVDRRKHLRLFLDEEVQAKVKFLKNSPSHKDKSQLFDKKCFDLSAGGLSFVVSKPESKFFKIGDYVKLAKIFFERKEVLVAGRILNVLELEPDERNKLMYKGQKICVKFEKIDSKSVNLLNEFVFRHVDLNEAV